MNTSNKSYSPTTILNAKASLMVTIPWTSPNNNIVLHCLSTPCTYLAWLWLDILLTKGLQTHDPFPSQPTITWKLHYIVFTYNHDHFLGIVVQHKIGKFTPNIATITIGGWQIQPLIVVIAGQWGGIHTPTLTALIDHFKLPSMHMKHWKHKYTTPPFAPSLPSFLTNANLKPNPQSTLSLLLLIPPYTPSCITKTPTIPSSIKLIGYV